MTLVTRNKKTYATLAYMDCDLTQTQVSEFTLPYLWDSLARKSQLQNDVSIHHADLLRLY